MLALVAMLGGKEIPRKISSASFCLLTKARFPSKVNRKDLVSYPGRKS